MKTRVVLIFCILFCAQLVLAQTQEPAPAQEVGRRVTLRYRPAADSYFKHRMTMDSQTAISGGGEQASLIAAMTGGGDIQTTMTMTLAAKVQSVAEDRSLKVKNCIAQMNVNAMGMEMDLTDQIGKPIFTITMTELGKPTKIEGLEGMVGGGMMAGQMMQSPMAGMSSGVVFQEKEVAVGDSWEATMEMPTGQKSSTGPIKVSNKLVAFETKNDRDCAKIETEVSGESYMPEEAAAGMQMMGVTGKMKMVMSGTFTNWVEVATGLPVLAQGKLKVVMAEERPAPKEGEKPKEGDPLTMSTSATINLELADVTEADKKLLADKPESKEKGKGGGG